MRSILQRANGNQAVQRMLPTDAEQSEVELTEPESPRFGHDFSRIPLHRPAAGAIQTKLAINAPGDSYEQEADRMAEQVMRTPEPQLQRAGPCGGRCPKCHAKQPGREHESLQTKHVQASDTGQIAAPPIVHEVLRSHGQPLDPATRAFMEPRFGYDFSRVQVHLGGAAEKSARDVDAHAYTVGHDIVFGASRFAPEAHEGRRLIAHELAHVVQQQKSQANIQRQPAKRGGRDRISNPAIDDVYDQLDIIREGQLPLEFHNQPQIRALSFGERQQMEFKRKLDAIGKLGNLRDQRAVLTLVAVLENKISPIKGYSPAQQLLLKQAAANSLAQIGGQAALSKLNDLLNSKDAKERLMAARGFSDATGGQAATILLAALKKETDADIKAQIIFVLGKIGSGLSSDPEMELIVKDLGREMEVNTGRVQVNAINALEKIRLQSATEALLKQLKKETDADIKSQIITVLENIGSGVASNQEKELIVKGMIREMESNIGEVRLKAIVALGKIKLKSATEALLKQLKLLRGTEELAVAIIKALGEIGDDRAIELLVILHEKDASPLVRGEAATALGKIRGPKGKVH